MVSTWDLSMCGILLLAALIKTEKRQGGDGFKVPEFTLLPGSITTLRGTS